MWESQKSSEHQIENNMLNDLKGKNMFIQSPNKHLNLFFEGGVHHGMITQIYGEAGSGKTQTAMLFALGAMSKNLIVGYLSTEKDLHFGRFTQLAYSYMNEAEYEERENYVMYKRTTDYNNGMQFIEEVLGQIKQSQKGGLLIIDSVYSFMNSCFESLNIDHDNLQKSRKQAEFVNRIRLMAKASRTAVIMINQASDNFDGRRTFSMGGNFIPALGPSWDLNMDESIQISKKGNFRQMKILNSPKCKVNTKKKFRITSEGFMWISEDGVEYQ